MARTYLGQLLFKTSTLTLLVQRSISAFFETIRIAESNLFVFCLFLYTNQKCNDDVKTNRRENRRKKLLAYIECDKFGPHLLPVADRFEQFGILVGERVQKAQILLVRVDQLVLEFIYINEFKFNKKKK